MGKQDQGVGCREMVSRGRGSRIGVYFDWKLSLYFIIILCDLIGNSIFLKDHSKCCEYVDPLDHSFV